MGKASKGARASLGMRLPEIRDALRDPVARSRFTQVFDSYSDIFDIISQLGLGDHPVVVQATLLVPLASCAHEYDKLASVLCSYA